MSSESALREREAHDGGTPVTLRLEATPLEADFPVLAPRARTAPPPGLEEAFVPAPGTEDLRRRFGRPDALVVTTGQQPGLFTGPLYTLYKALSAAALAARLEEIWDRPVVPVFWLAGDDHDYAEARGTAWLDPRGELVRAELAPRAPGEPLTPMYRLPLGPDVSALIERFGRSVEGLPFAEATVTWLRSHYAPGRTMGAAFGSALAELLAPWGVLCLDTTHPAVKRAIAPRLLGALAAASELDADLARRTAELTALGRPAPVAAGDGAGLVFLEDTGGRDRLVLGAGGFATRRTGTRYSLDQLAVIAEREPTRLSANVLLRPVVESALLPTVAYIAGPGELAYLPLAEPVYQRLGIPVQTPVPRWSGLVIEPRVERTLARFGATLAELMAGEGVLERRVIHSALPPALLEAVERLRQNIALEYDRIREAAETIDPTLGAPVDRLRHEARAGIDRGMARIERHLRRREATELTKIARARTAVTPGGRPQERVLGPAGFLARYGPAFVESVAGAIGEWYAGALVGAMTRP